MTHADFVHLRVHSAYSLSTGAIKVKELVEALPAPPHAGGGDHRHRQSLRRAGIRHRRRRGGGAADHRLRAGDPPREAGEPAARLARVGPAPAPDKLVLLVQDEAGLSPTS